MDTKKTLEMYYLETLKGHYTKYEEWERNLSEYERRAIEFLLNTNTVLDIDYIGHGHHFDEDKETRDIYRFTLKREGRKYTAKFGQSIAHSGTPTESYKVTAKFNRTNPGSFPTKPEHFERKRQKPTAYDILACMTKHDIGSFEYFCGEFGYDVDSRKAEQTYFAVQREYKGVCLIWNAEEREQLADIN